LGNLAKAVLAGTFGFSLTGPAAGAGAPEIPRLYNPNSQVQIAQAVTVPAGYTTYYISGAATAVTDPKAPEGSPKRFGDTEAQTAATLKTLHATMGKLGLTFGDVVAAHVFLAGDPTKGGKMDFQGMNRAWSKEFGTKEQPNKPARAAFQIAALAGASALVEIEFIAAKKVP
jgi:enamine deaminase RidA (YjgF/YER057c/UK114 family)